MGPDPDHPILEHPFRYAIGAFHYHTGLDGTEPYIDLDLHKDDVVRRLRSWSPQQLQIEPGFPQPTGGLIIQDVRRRQLEGLGVRVTDFESNWGKIDFWARAVEDRDAAEAS